MPLFVSSCFGESDEVSLGSVKLESSVKSMVTVAEGGGATAITSINSVYGIAGSGSVSQSVYVGEVVNKASGNGQVSCVEIGSIGKSRCETSE